MSIPPLHKLTPRNIAKGINAKLRVWYARLIVRNRFVFTDKFGMQIYLFPPDNLFDYFFHNGLPELWEQNFVRQYLREGMTVLDVGANIGLYSLQFSKLVGNRGKVFSFEPIMYERFLENMKLNNVKNVTLEQMLVMAKSGQEIIHEYLGGLNGLHTVAQRNLPGVVTRDKIMPATFLDLYGQEKNIRRIDFLKIDVEGAEYEVLKGASGYLAQKSIGCILFEAQVGTFGAMGVGIGEVVKYLKGFGFGTFEFNTKGKLVPALREDYIQVNLIAFHQDDLGKMKQFLAV